MHGTNTNDVILMGKLRINLTRPAICSQGLHTMSNRLQEVYDKGSFSHNMPYMKYVTHTILPIILSSDWYLFLTLFRKHNVDKSKEVFFLVL